MTRRLLFSRHVLCGALVSLLSAVPASAQTTLQRNAVSGALASVAEERSWQPMTCLPQSLAVTILEQPTNGTVTIRDETLRIPDVTPLAGPTGPCAGRQMAGKHLYYQSKPGFLGADRIVYSANYGGSLTRQIVVNLMVTSQPMSPPPSQQPHPTTYRTVQSGIATDIGGVTRWGADCEPLPPTLVIAEPPQHGTTAIRDEPAAIPARDSNGNPVPCVGRRTTRKTLYYQSQPGFQGTDQLVYDTEHGRYPVEITVGAGGSR